MIKQIVLVAITLFAVVKGQAGYPVSFEILQDGRLIALNHTTGIYSTICSQNWDDVDAGVVCRNLGLSQSGQAKTLPRDWVFNRGVFSIYCNGAESHISDCPMDTYDTTYGMCDSMSDAAIECHAGYPVSFEILQDGRLIALNHTTGIYSTICSQNWDDVDAGVVCRNLGLSQSGQAKTLPRDWVFNRGVFSIYCNGAESHISDCPMDTYDTTYGMCDSMSDAAIECHAGYPVSFEILQDGRLIALNHTTGIYSTICSQNWDDVDAGVVCRNLGLSQSGQAKTLPRDWVFNRGVFSIYCNGAESHISDCPMDTYDTTYGMCDSMSDAAIECHAGYPVSFEILQDGRLIALNHTTGIYSTICSQNWDDVDAGVVCRNLGLSQSGQAKTLPRDWVFNRGVFSIYCNGAESHISDCPMDTYDTTYGMCDSMSDAAIECHGSLSPTSTSQMWPIISQIQSTSSNFVAGSSMPFTQIVQNNMQTSASQMWPMNSQLQPSSSFVAGNSMQPTQVWPMNSQMLPQSSSYVLPNNMQTSASQMWPMNSQVQPSSSFVGGNNIQPTQVWPMNSQMLQQSSSYVLPNNIQTSASQMWPMNSQAQPSSSFVAGSSMQPTQVWPMNSQMLPQSSSSVVQNNMQTSASQMWPMNSQAHPSSSFVAGNSMQPTQVWPMNSQMPPQSSSYVVPNNMQTSASQMWPMNSQVQPSISFVAGYSMHPTQVWPMNSQMLPQSSSSVVQNNMQTSASQMWPMNSQVQPSSSFVAGNSMQPTQVWPMNSQMLQQSSSYVVPNNIQTSASQMWPMNSQVQPSISFGAGNSMQPTQVWPMNSQMPPQSSSYVVPNNMHTSASQMWPMNSQVQPSSSFVAGNSMQPTQVWPMNSQMLPQSSSSVIQNNMQTSASQMSPMNSQLQLSSSFVAGNSMQPTQVWPMNSQMLPQSSSYVLPNNMQTSASQMWPMNSQVQPSSSFVAGNSIQPTQVWPMNSQMLPQSSSYVLPNNIQTSASQMWPMNSQAQPSSSFVAGSSMQPTQVLPMNSQMLPQSSSSVVQNNMQTSASQMWPMTSQIQPTSSNNAAGSSTQMMHVSSMHSQILPQSSNYVATSSTASLIQHTTTSTSATPVHQMTTTASVFVSQQMVSASASQNQQSSSSVSPVVTQQMTTSILSSSTQQASTTVSTSSTIAPSSSSSSSQSSQAIFCSNNPTLCLSGNLGSGGSSVWSFYSWKMVVFSIILVTATTKAMLRR